MRLDGAARSRSGAAPRTGATDRAVSDRRWVARSGLLLDGLLVEAMSSARGGDAADQHAYSGSAERVAEPWSSYDVFGRSGMVSGFWMLVKEPTGRRDAWEGKVTQSGPTP